MSAFLCIILPIKGKIIKNPEANPGYAVRVEIRKEIIEKSRLFKSRFFENLGF